MSIECDLPRTLSTKDWLACSLCCCSAGCLRTRVLACGYGAVRFEIRTFRETPFFLELCDMVGVIGEAQLVRF